MKINPTESHRQVVSKPSGIVGTQEQSTEFNTILRETVGAEKADEAVPAAMPRAIQAVEFIGQPERTVQAVRQTGEMLDTFDTYRQLLADPNASLRRIQPVVEQLEQEAGNIQTMMLNLPQTHAMTQVMNDTLIQVRQEIERFYQGDYI